MATSSTTTSTSTSLPRVAVLCGHGYNDPIASVDEHFPARLEGKVELVSFAEACECASDPARAVVGALSLVHPPMDDSVIARLGPNLKVISNYGVGVDHIDLAAARRRGVDVANTPNILSDATADMAFALLLGCARHLGQCDRFARSPEFTHYQNMLFCGEAVAGATLGIVGMGRIGCEVARRATGFRMRILYHNRRPQPEAEAELGAVRVPLPELLAQADFVVLTCPLTAETRHLIDAAALQTMKPSASLINVARGGVVDQLALAEALDTGRIAAAGIDVFEPEPLPRDHPLNACRTAILTPHRGSATKQARQRMLDLTCSQLLAGATGQPIANIAN